MSSSCPVREPPTSTPFTHIRSASLGTVEACGKGLVFWVFPVSETQFLLTPYPHVSSDRLLTAECCVDLLPLQLPWRCWTWGGRVPGKIDLLFFSAVWPERIRCFCIQFIERSLVAADTPSLWVFKCQRTRKRPQRVLFNLERVIRKN